MKRGLKMVLLLVLLAVTVVGYFGAQQFRKTESISETAGTFDLTARTADDLMGISWTKDDTTFSFKYEDGTWATTGDPAWPVDQEALQDLADQLISLQATRKLEDVKNEADYGLETPAITVTAVWKDGTSTAYSMGDATPFADGYYLMLSGQSGTVYTIVSSLAETFDKTQKDLAAMEEIPAVTEASRLTVGGTFDAQKKEASTTVDPGQLWYDAASDRPLDSTKVENLIASAQGIVWNELVTAGADAETLAGWELDDGHAVPVSLTGSDGSAATVLFGTLNDDGDYYARLPGSDMVYTVESGDVSGLLTASPDSMAISAVLPLPYEYLAEATLTAEKGSLRITRAVEENISGNEPDEAGPSETGESEEQADTEAARKELWEQVAALNASGQAEEKADGDQVLSIHAVSTEGIETMVVFNEYSADLYLAAADGGTPVTVDAAAVDAIIRTVRANQ